MPRGQSLSPDRRHALPLGGRGEEEVLRFSEPGKTARPVALTLYKDGRHLIGSIWRHAGRTRGETDPLRLEKVD